MKKLLAVMVVLVVAAIASQSVLADLGVNWTQASNPNWSARQMHGSVVFDGKMWVMGGISATPFNDVWSSSDGLTWTQTTADAGWSNRSWLGVVAFDSKLWVIGGYEGWKTDVWSSSDGVNWTEVTSAANWSSRFGQVTLVFDNKLWVIGGNDGMSNKNDVWSSSDGVNWANVGTLPGAIGKSQSAVFDNKMWVFGSAVPNSDIVYYSTDGVTWIDATTNSTFPVRHSGQVAELNGELWLFGGQNSTFQQKDVWSSSDGINWTLVTADAGMGATQGPGLLGFNDELWKLGGFLNPGGVTNSVWYSSSPISGPTAITDCQVISTPGEYVLANDLYQNTTLGADACLYVSQLDDVTIDGQGYTIYFSNTSTNNQVIWFEGTFSTFSDNVTIKNLNINVVSMSDWLDAISLYYYSNLTVENVNITYQEQNNDWTEAFYVDQWVDGVISNVIVDGAEVGLYGADVDGLVIHDSSFTTVTSPGGDDGPVLYFDGGFDNIVVYNNYFEDDLHSPLQGAGSNWLFYNNTFNWTNETYAFTGTHSFNNTVGGNTYVNPAGTGFSQTCTNDGSGVCTEQYNFTATAVDYLPVALTAVAPNVNYTTDTMYYWKINNDLTEEGGRTDCGSGYNLTCDMGKGNDFGNIEYVSGILNEGAWNNESGNIEQSFLNISGFQTMDFWFYVSFEPESIAVEMSSNQDFYFAAEPPFGTHNLTWDYEANNQDGGEAIDCSVAGTIDVINNTWNHLVYTFSGTHAVGYLNGVEFTNDACSLVYTDSDSYIAFEGKIDNVILLNESYNSEDVVVSYNTGAGVEFEITSGPTPPTYTNFDGDTTDFSTGSDNVSQPVLEMTSYGKIVWDGSNLDFSANDFDSYITMGAGWISVDSANLGVDVNTSAQVTFYGSYNLPVIYVDGEVCTSCTFVSSGSGEQVFNVPHFTNYTIQNGTNITSCGVTITVPGEYQLMNDVTGTGLSCINVSVAGVSIDGQGYTINGTTLGVYYNVNNVMKNTVIENTVFTTSLVAVGWTYTGGTAENGNATFRNNTVYGGLTHYNYDGVLASTGWYIYDNVFDGQGASLFLDLTTTTQYVYLSNNIVRDYVSGFRKVGNSAAPENVVVTGNTFENITSWLVTDDLGGMWMYNNNFSDVARLFETGSSTTVVLLNTTETVDEEDDSFGMSWSGKYSSYNTAAASVTIGTEDILLTEVRDVSAGGGFDPNLVKVYNSTGGLVASAHSVYGSGSPEVFEEPPLLEEGEYYELRYCVDGRNGMPFDYECDAWVPPLYSNDNLTPPTQPTHGLYTIDTHSGESVIHLVQGLKVARPNIIGGVSIGGNYWSTYDPCAGTAGGSFCSVPYQVETGVYDYLPLGVFPFNVDLTACGAVDITGATYTLQNDIPQTTGDCLSVTASDVVVDGQGYAVGSTYTLSGSNVYVSGSNVEVYNMTIHPSQNGAIETTSAATNVSFHDITFAHGQGNGHTGDIEGTNIEIYDSSSTSYTTRFFIQDTGGFIFRDNVFTSVIDMFTINGGNVIIANNTLVDRSSSSTYMFRWNANTGGDSYFYGNVVNVTSTVNGWIFDINGALALPLHVYDNEFNGENASNIVGAYVVGDVLWNSSTTGNYWSSYSETCAGTAGGSFCDDPYQIEATGDYDYLPVGVFPYDVNLTDCAVLNIKNATYHMVGNLTDKTSGAYVGCMDIQNDDIVFDCHGYTFDGTDTTDRFAVSVEDYSVVQNCVFTDWGQPGSTNGGAVLAQGDFSTDARNATIVNNTFSSLAVGVFLDRYQYDDSGHIITRNTFLPGTAYGVLFSDWEATMVAQVYNNYFNADVAQVFRFGGQDITDVEFNTTATTATNIAGGPTIAGNWWKGTSEVGNCVDVERDELCDDALVVYTSYDYLPLADLRSLFSGATNVTSPEQNDAVRGENVSVTLTLADTDYERIWVRTGDVDVVQNTYSATKTNTGAMDPGFVWGYSFIAQGEELTGLSTPMVSVNDYTFDLYVGNGIAPGNKIFSDIAVSGAAVGTSTVGNLSVNPVLQEGQWYTMLFSNYPGFSGNSYFSITPTYPEVHAWVNCNPVTESGCSTRTYSLFMTLRFDNYSVVVNGSNESSYVVPVTVGDELLGVGSTDISGEGSIIWTDLDLRVSNLGVIAGLATDESVYWILNEDPQVSWSLTGADGYGALTSDLYLMNGSTVVASILDVQGEVAELDPVYNAGASTSYARANTFIAQGDVLTHIDNVATTGGCVLYYIIYEGSNPNSPGAYVGTANASMGIGTCLVSGGALVDIVDVSGFVKGQSYMMFASQDGVATQTPRGYWTGFVDSIPDVVGWRYRNSVWESYFELTAKMVFVDQLNYNVSFNESVTTSYVSAHFQVDVTDTLFNESENTTIVVADAMTIPVVTGPSTEQNGDFNVTWSASVENLGVTNYMVQQSLDGGAFTLVNTTTDTYVQITADFEGDVVYQVRANDGYVITTYDNGTEFAIVLSPQLGSQVCALTYPNEDNLPVIAELPVNFSVYAPLGFTSPSAEIRLKLGGETYLSTDCSYVETDSKNRDYSCNVSMNYWYGAGDYDLNITFTDLPKIVTVEYSGECAYGQLVASSYDVSAVAFSGAGPGINNVVANQPITVRNTGNVELDLKMTAYDLSGRTNPSVKLPATAFKAGASLGTSVVMADSVQKNLSMTVVPSSGAEDDVWLWLSMPVGQLIQDYYSENAWQVVGTG